MRLCATMLQPGTLRSREDFDFMKWKHTMRISARAKEEELKLGTKSMVTLETKEITNQIQDEGKLPTGRQSKQVISEASNTIRVAALLQMRSC